MGSNGEDIAEVSCRGGVTVRCDAGVGAAVGGALTCVSETLARVPPPPATTSSRLRVIPPYM